MEVVFHRLIKLRCSHPVRLLNGLVYWKLLVLHQIEVSPRLWQLIFVQKIMNQNPRLRIKQRVVRSFLPIHHPILHSEQVGKRQPDWIAQNLSERLQPIGLGLIPEKVSLVSRVELGIAAYLRLFRRQIKGSEVFGKAFIKPRLGRWIVVIQQIVRKLVLDCPPADAFNQTQYETDAVVASQKKGWSCDGLSISDGRNLGIVFGAADRDDLHRLRHS